MSDRIRQGGLVGITLFFVLVLWTEVTFYGQQQEWYKEDTNVYIYKENQYDVTTRNPHNVTGLSNQVTEYPQKDSNSSSQVNGKPPCTLAYIRGIVQKSGFVPHEGTWSQKDNKYQLKGCSFPEPVVDYDKLLNFFLRTNVTRFTVLGDSNGHRYLEGFLHHLTHAKGTPMFKCTQLKRERKGGLPEPSYYANDITKEEDIVVGRRNCRSCSSFKHRCQGLGKFRDVSLEMENVVDVLTYDARFKTLKDPSMRTQCMQNKQLWESDWLPFEELANKSVRDKCFRSYTLQEFLVREYWLANPVDLLLWFFPIAHDINVPGMTASTFGKSVEYFLRLQQKYLPPTTKVLFFTSHAHNVPKKPAKYRNRLYEGRYDTTAQLGRINRAIVDAVAPCMKHERDYLFPDLLAMSQPKLHWNTDGVHWTPQWYEIVGGYTWNVLAHSQDEWLAEGT